MAQDGLSRRDFIKQTAIGGLTLAAGTMLPGCASLRPMPELGNAKGTIEKIAGYSGKPPNIIVILADDLGYGDLECYGSRAIQTPAIDEMASQGVRFTEFNSCDSVCTPSRAGLLTGRYPKRMGLDIPLEPENLSLGKYLMIEFGYLAGHLGLLDLATEGGASGLSPREITVAEALKIRDYHTCMIGKWHLGDFSQDPRFNPTHYGFDHYFGVPYSNDMQPLPLFRNTTKLESNVDQDKLTGLYTQEAVKFIEDAQNRPFFLYLAHTFPHRPLHASAKFRNKSQAGLFGDAVEELDWSTAQILDLLRRLDLDHDTLVMFTSDNGPWYQGSPGGFRGRKGQSYEGGHRVPFIARWPGHIPAGTTCRQPAMNTDIFPTCLALAGLTLPRDRIIDGKNITGLLEDPERQMPDRYFYFYHQGELEGIRLGKWKYISSINHYVWPMPVNKKLGTLSNYTTGPLPLLFNLDNDPDESYDMMSKYPEIGKKLAAAMVQWQRAMKANRVGLLK